MEDADTVEIEIENLNPHTDSSNLENVTLEVENDSTHKQTASIEQSIMAEEIEVETSNEKRSENVVMKNENTPQGLEQNKNIGQCKGNELDKFKRRLVRAVARLKISEKMSEDDMWLQLKKETTWDCKPLWVRMRALTIRKLHRLCGVEDRLDLIAKVAQLSVTDWLMFDLVLVHEDVDVIGQEDEANNEPKILGELFELVKKYQIENHSGDTLTKLWYKLTQEYNSRGRKCSPMLLQRRWYQLKVMVRYKFYNFWFSYRGMSKYLPEANAYKPTELQLEIAKHFVFIVVKEFISWEELIQEKKVSLPADFERLHLSKTKKVSLENEPDIIVIEPEVETIDLRLDSDASDDESGEILNEKLNEDTENTDGVNLVKVKTEIIDDISDEEDVRILESINIPLESQRTTEKDTAINNTAAVNNVANKTSGHTETDEIHETKASSLLDATNVLNESHVPYNAHSGNMSTTTTYGKSKSNNALINDSKLRITATDLIKKPLSEKNTEIINKIRETSQNIEQYNLGDDDISETPNDYIAHNEYENTNDNLALETTETINPSDELMMPKITSVTSSVEVNENNGVETQNEINAILEGVVGRIASNKCNNIKISKTKYQIPKRITHSADIIDINEEIAQVAERIPFKKPNRCTLSNIEQEEVPKRVEHSTDITDINEEIAQVAERIPFKRPNRCTLSNNEPEEVPNRVEHCTDIIEVNEEIAKVAESIPFKKRNSCTSSNNEPEEVPKRVEHSADIIDINEEIAKVAESIPLFKKPDPCTLSNNEPEDFCFIDGLELEDDGIEFIDEEQGDPVLKEKFEEEQSNEDNTPKIDLKLLLDPVVYTKKLDDMDVFRFIDYISVKDQRVIENTILESKPFDKKSINIEDISEECQNENESDDCSDDSSEYGSQEIITGRSWLFKKPTVTSYNPIQLCKNPDFNKRLNRLTAGFFSSERNRWLLKQCKPLTIDLHKSFESKLVNNRLLLYVSVNQTSKPISTLIAKEKLSSFLPEQNIINTPVTPIPVFPNTDESTRSSISSAHESTLNSTPSMHRNEPTLISTPSLYYDELIEKTTPAVHCNESVQLPTTDGHCNNERNKIINLPNYEQIRRVNEKLLVAEVSPIQVTNKTLPVKIITLNDTQVTGQNNDFQPNMENSQTAQIPSVSEINPNTKPAHRGPRNANSDKLSNQPQKLKKSIKKHFKRIVEKPVPRPAKLLKPYEYVLSETDRLLAFDTVERILKICKGNNYTPATKRLHKNEQIMMRKKDRPSSNKTENASNNTVCEDIENSVSDEYVKPMNEKETSDVRVERTEKVKSYSKTRILKKHKTNSGYCCWAREKFMFDKFLIANIKTTHTCSPRRCTCCCRSVLKKPRQKKGESYTVGKVFPPIDLVSDDESERTITRNSCRPIWRRTIGINTDFDPEFAGSLLDASRTFNIDLLIKNKVTDPSNDESNLHNKILECEDIEINKLVESSSNENQDNQTNECDNNKVDDFIGPSDNETLTLEYDNNELNRPMEYFNNEQCILECENTESNESNKLIIAIDSGIVVNNTNQNEKLNPVITNVQSLLQKPQLNPNKKSDKIILSPRTPKRTRCKTNVIHSPGPSYRSVHKQIIKNVPTKIIEQPPESLTNMKMLIPDNNVFLINAKSNYLPSQKPIFLGKSKILLCSFKPVVGNNEETLDNEVMQTIISNHADIINNIHEEFKSRLPQGIQLVLVRNREVAISINPGIELDTTQLVELPAIMALVQEQFDTKALEQIRQSHVKQIYHDSAEVIQLEDEQLTDMSETHKSSQIEIPEDTNNIVLGDNAVVNISSNETNSIDETQNIRDDIESHNVKIVVEKPCSPTANENEINTTQSKFSDETSIHKELNSGDQSIAETAKKTILSDLMEMSGISAEDTYINNIDSLPKQQINVLSTVQSPLNESDIYVVEKNKSDPTASSLALPAASDLNIITSFVELKYCYENNGHFYKMDINTGQIAPIKVCIKKQNVKSETKHLVPKTVIDLTDEPEDELESKSNKLKKITIHPISDLKYKEPQAVKPVRLFKAVRCPPIIRRSGKRLLMELTKNNPEFQAKRKKLVEIMKRKRNQSLLKEHTIIKNTNVTAPECNKTSDESLKPQKVESDSNSDSDDEPLALKVKRRKNAEKNTEMAVDVNKGVEDQSQGETAESESDAVPDLVTNKSDAVMTDVQPQLEPVAFDDSSDEDCILGV